MYNTVSHFGLSFPQIYPLTGPVQGKTLITIVGQNLGKSFAEIQNGVDIVGEGQKSKCTPINNSQHDGKR